MPLLQGQSQRLQLQGLPVAPATQQQVVHRCRPGIETGDRRQAGLQPGALPSHPTLHPPQPALIAEQGVTGGGRQAIHRPGIAPAGPAGQSGRIPQGIAEPQTGDRQQLGEAADHHQLGILRQQRHQRLGFPLWHQGKESLIDDHQGKAPQQRLERLAAPELAAGVVRVGDPEHLGAWRHGETAGRLRQRPWPRRGPVERQRQRLPAASPAGQGPAVIGKARSGQQAGAGGGRITGRPGEQLGGTVARQHRLGIQAVVGGDRLTQIPVGAIGVVPQGGPISEQPGQATPQASRRPEGHQRGTGIEQLLRPAAEATGGGKAVAAMELGGRGQGAGGNGDARL